MAGDYERRRTSRGVRRADAAIRESEAPAARAASAGRRIELFHAVLFHSNEYAALPGITASADRKCITSNSIDAFLIGSNEGWRRAPTDVMHHR